MSCIPLPSQDVFKRAEEKGIKIEVTDKFKDRLVDEGFNPTYGARPLRRAIMRLIEDCLAERILSGDIKASHGLCRLRCISCLEAACECPVCREVIRMLLRDEYKASRAASFSPAKSAGLQFWAWGLIHLCRW
jgi:hypothetical protein